ncbi:MAG: DUF4349 domain-containing protein [Erythrobacter sp.]
MALTGCSDLEPRNEAEGIVASVEPPSARYADEAPENEFGFVEAMEQSPGLFDLLSGPLAVAAQPMETTTVDITAAPSSAGTNTLTAQPDAQQSQIAYSYDYGFRIDSDEMLELQQAHTALCDAMGDQCRIIRSSQARADSYDAYGELQLQIAADKAGELTQELEAPAIELGGALISSVKDGEDLSEQIIDAEARLRSRLVLREKLTDILRSQRGSVDELVKAESEVAKVNEEIDATRTRLEQFRNRIRFSDVRVSYEPAFGETQVGFVRPVTFALRSIGSTLGMSLAAIIYALTALAPIALLLFALRWVLHRFGYRLRFWKTDLRKDVSDPAV